MKKQTVSIFLLTLFCITFFSCNAMAELFHGPKPEDPPVTFTVSFNANGADGTAPTEQTVNEGTVISLPDRGNLTKGTDVFVGWSESASGTIYDVGSFVTVTRDMLFYARWFDINTPKFTVTFHANEAAGEPPEPKTVYSGVSITIPDRGTLNKSGKVFSGWNTLESGGGTNYLAGATYKVTGHITLYAKWLSEIQYKVTYHANGASGAVPAELTVDPGTVITLPGAGSLTYIGRTFEGWNTSQSGTGTSYAEGDSYTVNGNVTFYAQWLSVLVTPPRTEEAPEPLPGLPVLRELPPYLPDPPALPVLSLPHPAGPAVPVPQKKPQVKGIAFPWQRVFFAITARPRWNAARIAAPTADGSLPLSAVPNAALPQNRTNFPKAAPSAVTVPQSKVKYLPDTHLFQNRENFPFGCML